MAKRRPRPKPTERISEEIKAAEETIKDDPHRPIARDLEIYELYCEGQLTYRELAARCKLSKSRIADICQRVESWLATRYVMEIRNLRMRSTMRLETIYQKAIRGFEESRQDEVAITTVTESPTMNASKKGNKKAEDAAKVTELRRGQSGSPAFLQQAREAVKEVLELWGGKAPRKIEVEVNEAMRVGGRTPEQAVKSRLEYLKTMLSPNGN